MAIKIKHRRNPVWGDDFDLECELRRSSTGASIPIDGSTLFSLSFRLEPETEDEDAELYLTQADAGVFTIISGPDAAYHVHVGADVLMGALQPEQPYYYRQRVQLAGFSSKAHVMDEVIFVEDGS